MKKALLLLSLAMCGVAHAQVTGGLVAKYSFDQGNANDEVGRNHGTVHDAELTTDRFGRPDHAYQFIESRNSYIEITHNDSNNFSSAQSFSIAYWVKFDDYVPLIAAVLTKHIEGYFNGVIFAAHNSLDQGYCFGEGTLFFYAASGGQEDVCADTLIASETENWHFITGIYNADDNTLKMYIDAVQQVDVGTTAGEISNTANLFLGGNPTHANPNYFSGKLDDLRIYNRALGQQEIDTLYNYQDATGVEEIAQLAQKIIVAPNPGRGVVTFSSQANMSLFNATGQLMMKVENTSAIDLSELSAGIYMAVFTDNKGNVIQRSKISRE